VNPPGLSSPWTAEPLVLALAAVAVVCFAQGFLRLRRRGRADHAGWYRAGLFAVGLAILVLPLVSPLDLLGDRYLLSAHMLQHVLIADVAPALILVALRGPLLFFVVPTALLSAAGHTAWLRRFASWLFRPLPVLVVWALAFGLWHIPAAYDAAARHPLVHDLEHASFVIAGFLVWTILIDPAGHHRVSLGRRLAMIGALFAMGTVIADVLIFSLRPLYPAYADQAHRVFGLSPLHDQQFAGIVMNLDQILTLGTCAALLLLPALRRRRRASLVGAGQPA
jgi:putative membrane protein